MTGQKLEWIDIEPKIRSLLTDNKIAEATELLLKSLDEIADKKICGILLSELYKLTGETDKALSILKYLQSIYPNFIEPCLKIAEILKDRGDILESLDHVKTALFLDSNNETALNLYRELNGNKYDNWQNGVPDIIFYTGNILTGKLPQPSRFHNLSIGGSESVLFTLARAIHKLGKRVAIFSNFTKYGVSGGIECSDIRHFFTRQINEQLPTSVVSRFYNPFIQSFNAKKRIYWLHDIVMPSYRTLYEKMDLNVDEYAMLSNYQIENYSANVGLKKNKSWLTTNCIERELFGEKIGLGSRNQMQLIYTSRPSRGLDIALEVFHKLKKSFPKLKLIAATYSNKTNVMEDPELIPMQNLLNHPDITVASFNKKELAAALKSSSILLYPNSSDMETSCLSAIESMGAATPVVTSDRGCLSETVLDGKTGIVTAWHNDKSEMIDALSENCAELLTNSSKWNEISDNAYEHAWKRFDSEILASQWIDHFGI